MTAKQVIIFTDMDGSLLDHDTYSHAAADKCLQTLSSMQIPVIPCTSKTRLEVEIIRQDLNNLYPFIVENGAAIYMPEGYFLKLDESLDIKNSYVVKTFTQPRAYWQSVLENAPMHLNDAIISFEQAGIEGIMQMTGLSIDQARLASHREYGEPLKWSGSQQQYDEFKRYVHSKQGTLLKGGRFVHLSGHCDKGHALKWLMRHYQQDSNADEIISIALGDSQNDVAMLSAADYAVMIKSPVHDFPLLESRMEPHLYRTQNQGPHGWVEGIHYVFTQLGIEI